MKLRKSEIAMFIFVGVAILINLVFYPYMPDKVARHFDSKGNADGYVEKIWSVFLIPGILSIFSLFFLIVPRIDPIKTNIENYGKYYDIFLIFFCIFMMLVNFHVILWNMGFHISPEFIVPALVVLLLIFAGYLKLKGIGTSASKPLNPNHSH